MVGFSGVDEHFGKIGPIFRHSVEIMEDLKYAMMLFKESCGHEPQVDLLNSTRWMLARAEQSGVSLKVGSNKVCTYFKLCANIINH